MNRSSVITPIIFLAFMNAIWAGSYTVMKFGAETLQPIEIVFLRISVSFLVMTIWFIFCGKWEKISKKDAIYCGISGLLVAAGQFMTVTGVGLSKASHASLLFAFEPIFGIVLAAIILKEKMRPSYFFALFLALIGLFILSNPSKLDSPEIGIGNLLVVAGIICEVFFSIILKPVSGRVPALQVTLIWLAVCTATLSVPMLPQIGEMKFSGMRDIFVIGYLSLVCTVLGYWLWVKFMKKIPVSIMYFTIFVQPIAGPFIAWIFLKDRPTASLGIAAVFLLSGLVTAVSGFLRAIREEHRQTEKDVSFDGSSLL